MAATDQPGMWAEGNWLTQEQIRNFYANGGNDREYAQKLGITDPGMARDLILKARQLAGPGTMQGEGAMQQYFKEYQKYNPNGAFANDYQGWADDFKGSNVAGWNAIQSGTYTGTPNTGADSAPGGIYGPGTGHDFSFQQSGQGARGMGDGWTEGAWAGHGNGGGQPQGQVTNMGYIQNGIRRAAPPYQPGRGGQPTQGAGEWANYWDFTNGRRQQPQMRQANPIAQDNFYTPNTQRNYGSWPSGGYSSQPTGASRAAASGSDTMYGDYTNGW